MKRETREVNGTASPSADVSFLYAQDRARLGSSGNDALGSSGNDALGGGDNLTLGSKIRAFYERRVRLLTIFALACILSVSGVLIAKRSTDYGASRQPNNNEQNVESSVDFGYLVDKYNDYFVLHDNGTVSIDTGYGRVHRSAIADDDREALESYAKSLDAINELVADGTMYIADDGQYLMSETDSKQGRDWSGGVNDFYVRTESHKVLFWWVDIPVGYHLSLGTMGAIAFGVITGVISFGMAANIASKAATQKWILGILVAANFVNDVAAKFVDENIDWLYGILFGIYVVGITVAAALSASGGGSVVAAVLKVIVAILSTYIYQQIGERFFIEGVKNVFNSNNTVQVETNLILLDKTWWVGRR